MLSTKRFAKHNTIIETLVNNYAFNFGMLFVDEYTGREDYAKAEKGQVFLRE